MVGINLAPRKKTVGRAGQRGQGMTEYILIVILIAIGLIAVFTVFRGKLGKGVDKAAQQIEKTTNDNGYQPGTSGN